MATGVQSSIFSRSYNSFSGVDIKAVFANKVIAELQAISYSITREKAPIYTMGSADPRSFSRGKRGIAGTLIFIVFDRHGLLKTLDGLKFQSDKDDIRSTLKEVGLQNNPRSLANAVADANNRPPRDVATSESELDAGIGSDQELTNPWYVDQIPPFDVTLAAANEYGALAVMRIYGVELLNEGYGVSIDDIVSEQQFTYVARTLVGWTPVVSNRAATIASQGASGA